MKHAKSLLAAAAISLSSSLMGNLAFADSGADTTDYVDPAWAAQIGAALSEAMPANNPAFLRNSVAGQSMVVRIQLDEAGNVTTFEPVGRVPSIAMHRVFRKTRKKLDTLPAYPGGKATFHADLGYNLEEANYRKPARGFAMVE